MGVLSGFGGWINQNIQQPSKAESKSSENVKSKSISEINTHEEKDEMKEQLKLWRDAEKKKPWYDAPAKVKVATQEGYCVMKMEFTLGLPPQTAYDVLSNNPDKQRYLRNIKRRGLLENISGKVKSDHGSGPVIEVEKVVSWNFLWWSGAIPISIDVAVIPTKLAGVYMEKKMMFMKTFEGNWKVEPIYVDSERLCKHMKPKSSEEYRKCSGGQGLIASKVKMDQVFQPSSPFNLPPLSWFIRGITVKTTKTVIKDLQNLATAIRIAEY